jgi:hypothetical protein
MSLEMPIQSGLGGSSHLTAEQLGDLLAAVAPASAGDGSPMASAEAHLLSCEKCAAEFASLRESLTLFRQACTAYADDELHRLPRLPMPARPLFSPALDPVYWVAAAAVFLAALLPVQMLHQRSLRPRPPATARIAETPAESDEALLEDVSREASASVPAPMQALADPTGGVSSIVIEPSVQNSEQRKD